MRSYSQNVRVPILTLSLHPSLPHHFPPSAIRRQLDQILVVHFSEQGRDAFTAEVTIGADGSADRVYGLRRFQQIPYLSSFIGADFSLLTDGRQDGVLAFCFPHGSRIANV